MIFTALASPSSPGISPRSMAAWPSRRPIFKGGERLWARPGLPAWLASGHGSSLLLRVSYQGVSQAVGFVMSDIAKVHAICP